MRAGEETDLLVVGAGPAGLAAAEAVAAGGYRVIAVDREQEPGGVPRHCFHTGFGLRDLHRVQSGPAYATQRVQRAITAGAQVRSGWTVTGWESPTSVITTSRQGRTVIKAQAVLLATGCRERPRAARLVPGSRPAGVYTTGALQQLVHLQRHLVGKRAVVIGAEHIAFSAVHTLITSGTRVEAVVTESPVLQTFQLLRAATASLHRVPVLYRHSIQAIEGNGRVEGVRLLDTANLTTRRIECDTIVFTGDWIPDYELARAAGLDMDPATHGPLVDATGATSTPGVFAAGNLQHPAEPADVAALGGQSVAGSILRWLAEGPSGMHGRPRVQVRVAEPLAWVTPQLLLPGQAPARARFVLRASRPAGPGSLAVEQNGRIVHEQRVRRLTPNRSLTLRATWTGRMTADSPVTISYRSTA